MKKIAGFIFIVLILIVVAYFVVINLPQATLKNTEADYNMNATELYSAFESDESEANKKYIGKTIIVEGKVVSTEKDAEGAPVLILDGGATMGGVMCTFADKKDLGIQPGDNVKVKGLCTGVLMDVVLNKCILLKNE